MTFFSLDLHFPREIGPATANLLNAVAQGSEVQLRVVVCQRAIVEELNQLWKSQVPRALPQLCPRAVFIRAPVVDILGTAEAPLHHVLQPGFLRVVGTYRAGCLGKVGSCQTGYLRMAKGSGTEYCSEQQVIGKEYRRAMHSRNA